MKVLLDQGLPRSTVNHLAAAGIAAEHLGDVGLAYADDEAILDALPRAEGTRIEVVGFFQHNGRI
jgi:predicted nuclease of predicted toxin-antitoxin system